MLAEDAAILEGTERSQIVESKCKKIPLEDTGQDCLVHNSR